MNKQSIIVFLSLAVLIVFINSYSPNSYVSVYHTRIDQFKEQQFKLLKEIEANKLTSPEDKKRIKDQIILSRHQLKGLDFWLRYLEPLAYKKLNGPLPVEWETEVFEKFEKPYKRFGAGLTLAEIHLEEKAVKDTLLHLITASLNTLPTYSADSITSQLKIHSHFYLCNRLFLLNLASIYTTGFECPDTSLVIPELSGMLKDVQQIYSEFNNSFPETSLSSKYLDTYTACLKFVYSQSANYSEFDHFTFIKDYINPLYDLNHQFILDYKVASKSYVDYTLNKKAASVFDKNLYHGQNSKGIFLRVNDEKVLSEIDKVGKLLFFDPILSGNNERSCASCHKPDQFFTDTLSRTSLHFDHQSALARNTPSLVNVGFNHLLMMDGKHISLQDQALAVITNAIEMGGSNKDVVQKVLSCSEYNKTFKKLLKYTPQESEITIEHISSAITLYYSKFSNHYSPFDEAMNKKAVLDEPAKKGFNLFMSKAQCATCHFVPQFNGVKPPFVGSEFEVLGVPTDLDHLNLSPDKGRHMVNPAEETMNAFRTGSIRNAAFTKPYMHNGVFNTLEQVIDFYDGGGGAGKGLNVSNQTLSTEPLRLSKAEKANLIMFINSLNEKVSPETPPAKLPASDIKVYNKRVTGGSY
ncbi:MAG: cytochrome C peroxidase [Opitutaceae bacterium]|nr:cytochrome C peroxidase [Cytophagales bacterium]